MCLKIPKQGMGFCRYIRTRTQAADWPDEDLSVYSAACHCTEGPRPSPADV